MKKVLCFGDSNTYGFIPSSAKRYNEKERWSGILKNLAKDNFEIIEAGCNNRTATVKNPQGEEYTGYKILPKYLSGDIDITILQIGINDLQFSYNLSVDDIKIGLKNIIKQIKRLNNVDIILICPSIITENILNSFFSRMFDKSSIEKSKSFPKIYREIAKECNLGFIDLNEVAIVSSIDGLHYEKEEHKKIANAINEYIKKYI